MRQISGTEVELIAEIERLELDARETHRRLERAEGERDKLVLWRQLEELERQVEHLRRQLKES
jgi:hypothetical protein